MVIGGLLFCFSSVIWVCIFLDLFGFQWCGDKARGRGILEEGFLVLMGSWNGWYLLKGSCGIMNFTTEGTNTKSSSSGCWPEKAQISFARENGGKKILELLPLVFSLCQANLGHQPWLHFDKDRTLQRHFCWQKLKKEMCAILSRTCVFSRFLLWTVVVLLFFFSALFLFQLSPSWSRWEVRLLMWAKKQPWLVSSRLGIRCQRSSGTKTGQR